MIVSEIMNRNVERAGPETKIIDAARTMKEKDIDYLLVVDDSKLVGIVTEEDIVEKVVSEGREADSVTIGEIMVKDVIHIESDSSLEDAAKLMTEHKIKKLPVVENKKLLGIVTAQEMVAAEPKMMEHLGELVLFAKRQKRIAG
jgi:CBS domain-containing protein